jgi:hypothetical protein
MFGSNRIASTLFLTDGAVAAQTKLSHPGASPPSHPPQIHQQSTVQILGARWGWLVENLATASG